jgi:hypothetical protein
MKNWLLYPSAALIAVSLCAPALAESATDAILLRLEAKVDALTKANEALQTKLNRVEGTRAGAVAPVHRTATEAPPPGPATE